MIYLDNNATTPIHPLVKEIIVKGLEMYGNPSSLHKKGREAKEAIEKARNQVASLISAKSEEVIFTASGSESNNIVMNGVGGHVVTSSIEHPCVLESSGEATIVPVDKNGVVRVQDVEEAITEDTVLISIMTANNEIGSIQPIKELSELARSKDLLFHTDAIQALGKISLSIEGVDLMSLSAHKIYGMKGVGALYVRRGVNIKPLVVGGHQERGLRAGTENVVGIMAFGKAAELIENEMEESNKRVRRLRDRLREGVIDKVSNITINGDQDNCLPNTLNVTFKRIEGESIVLDLDLEGIAVSTGSACSSRSLEPSHVIKALGIPDQHAHGSIRFSLGRENTEEEINIVLEKLPQVVKRLRNISSE